MFMENKAQNMCLIFCLFNQATSFVHSTIVGLWALLLVLVNHQNLQWALGDNSGNSSENQPVGGHALICVTLGYFIFDAYDLSANTFHKFSTKVIRPLQPKNIDFLTFSNFILFAGFATSSHSSELKLCPWRHPSNVPLWASRSASDRGQFHFPSLENSLEIVWRKWHQNDVQLPLSGVG